MVYLQGHPDIYIGNAKATYYTILLVLLHLIACIIDLYRAYGLAARLYTSVMQKLHHIPFCGSSCTIVNQLYIEAWYS